MVCFNNTANEVEEIILESEDTVWENVQLETWKTDKKREILHFMI